MFIISLYILVGCNNKVAFSTDEASQEGIVLLSQANTQISRQLIEHGKVVICHVPPGNPDNAHTLEIGAPAVNAHLSHHDDYLGSCGEQGGGQSHECGEECQIIEPHQPQHNES